MVVTNTYRNNINDYINSISGWNYAATIRRYYKLKSHSAEKLMERLFKHKSIYQIFWVLENDTTGYDHMHLLLGSTMLGNYVDVKDKLNTYLGGKPNAQCFNYVKPIEPSEIKYYTGYCTKQLNGNTDYGILL